MERQELMYSKELARRITETGREFIKQIEETITKLDFPENEFNKDNKFELYKLLPEHCVYKVEVQANPSNPKHTAILHTGFKNGSYWIIYTNNYDRPLEFKEIYSIKILDYLCKID